MTKQEFSWRGRTVQWEQMGSGPEVVFCHGTPWSSELWRPFAEALAPDHSVYLWDMPGYGRSSKSAEHPVSLDVQGVGGHEKLPGDGHEAARWRT